MNKNKIAIIGIFIMAFLSFSPTVKAASPITAFGECAYNFTKGSNKMNSDYMSGSNMSFYFTEVSFKKDSTTGKLFVKDIEYSTYEDVSLLVGGKGYGLSSTDLMDDLDNAQTTFKKAYEANGGNCPKIFLLKKRSNSYYLPYFTNDESTTYCGSNNDNCLSVGQLSGTGSTVKVYPSEQTWNFSTSGERSCDGANVIIKIDSTGKLTADISYPKSSTFYEDSAQKTVTVSVDFGYSDCFSSEDANCQLNYIKNLVTKGTIKKGFVRGDDGDEKVNFNDGAFSKYSCDLLANKSTTPTYSCAKYDSVKSTVIAKKDTALASAKGIDDIATKYLYFNRHSDTYTSKSYSTVTDATTLYNTATEINKAIKDSTFSATSSSYIDYLNGLVTGQTLCTEDTEQIKSILSTYADLAAKKAAKVTVLKETLTKIKDRLTALGETEKAEEVAGYIDTANGVATDITSVSAKARTSMLASQKFGIKAYDSNNPCGVVSTDLKEFLQTIIDYIRIAGIALAVILGILDYIKVIFGSDEKSMAKANKNFSTRLIAVALLFLIPAVLTFILGLFNILGTGSAGTCGIK